MTFNVKVGARMVNQERVGYSGLRPEDWRIVVKQVDPGLPAEQAGLKVGDNIVTVNGTPVEQTEFGADQIIKAIQSSNGQPVVLSVKRDEQIVNITAAPKTVDGTLRLGFRQGLEGMQVKAVRLGPLAALRHSFDENLRILRLTKTALVQVIMGQRSARETFSGPIGIARISGEAAEQGVSVVIQLMALLSLNLGVFNLLPIPVLDGGLIFMLLLEAVLGLFGLSLTLRVKEKMMQVGFVMLVLLMGFVIFNDISKSVSLGGGQQQIEQQQPAEK
jgi:regulator of sigma E protease